MSVCRFLKNYNDRNMKCSPAFSTLSFSCALNFFSTRLTSLRTRYSNPCNTMRINQSAYTIFFELSPSNVVFVLSLYSKRHSTAISHTWVVPGSSTRSTSGTVKPVSVIRLFPVPGLGAAVAAIDSLEMGMARRAGRPAGRTGEGMKASALQYRTRRWGGGSGHKP